MIDALFLSVSRSLFVFPRSVTTLMRPGFLVARQHNGHPRITPAAVETPAITTDHFMDRRVVGKKPTIQAAHRASSLEKTADVADVTGEAGAVRRSPAKIADAILISGTLPRRSSLS
jgi:hypothetical protein